MKAENYKSGDEAVTERTPFLRWSGRNQVHSKTAPAHVIKAALYAVQTFYAFMLM
jgi:copper transporter 1